MSKTDFEIIWYDKRLKKTQKTLRRSRNQAFALAEKLQQGGHSNICYRRVGAKFWKGLFQ